MKKISILLMILLLFASLSRLSAQSNDCTGPNSEIHDDGTFENGYTLGGDSVRFIMKVQPTVYPWSYTKVCIGWTRVFTGPSSLDFDVMVYKVNANGTPGFLLKEFLGQHVDSIPLLPNVKWSSTELNLPILISGSYYIGVRFKNNPQREIFIASDESPATTEIPSYCTSELDYFQHWITTDSQWADYRSLAIRMSGEPGVDAMSCVNPEGAEIHDDGTFENAALSSYDTTILVQKFVPSEYPWKYTKVCVGWTRQFGINEDVRINYNIVVYDDSGPAGRPGNLVALIPGQRVIKIPARLEVKWNPTDLDIPLLNSGAYYIGVKLDNSPASGVFISYDQGPNTPLWRGYHIRPIIGWVANDSEWFNYMSAAIRTEGTSLTGIVQTNTEIPGSFLLEQNYPNPFNPETKIKFGIPDNLNGKASNVKMVVYDLLGRVVSTLVDKELKPGNYEVNWNASDFTSGVYFYKLISNDFTETKKMVLMK